MTLPPMKLLEIIGDEAHSTHSDTISDSRVATARINVLNKGRSMNVIASLTLVFFVNSVSTGLLTVGIPLIATDLKLSEGLLLWYGQCPILIIASSHGLILLRLFVINPLMCNSGLNRYTGRRLMTGMR